MAPRLASRDVQGVAAYLASDACQRVVVLTGAGVSCAAGIPDFRSPGGMYDTLRPELITASPQERAAMARDPTAVVLKDMFLQNQFPYHEVRRPFILGTQRQQWKATLFHRFLEVLDNKGKLLRLVTQNIDGLDFQTNISPDRICACHGSVGRAADRTVARADPVRRDVRLKIQAVDVLRHEPEELAFVIEYFKKPVEQRRLPLLALRPEYEWAPDLVVGELVLQEHVLQHDRRRVPRHRGALLRRGSDELRPQRVIHATWRSEIRNPGCAAHASSCQHDHALTRVAREVRRDALDVAGGQPRRHRDDTCRTNREE